MLKQQVCTRDQSNVHQSTSSRTIKEGALYCHYKGAIYKVIKIGYTTQGKELLSVDDIDDEVKLVIYTSDVFLPKPNHEIQSVVYTVPNTAVTHTTSTILCI